MEESLHGPGVLWLEELESTNSYARKNINSLEDAMVISAKRQIAGRGQGEHSWFSSPGKNITATLIATEDGIMASESKLISAYTALGICDYLEDRGIKAAIKLPNDIWVGERKICGILIENILKGKNVTTSIIGIGLNVNETEWPASLPNPVSMKELTNLEYVPEHELECLMKHIAVRRDLLRTPGGKEVLLREFDFLSFELAEK